MVACICVVILTSLVVVVAVASTVVVFVLSIVIALSSLSIVLLSLSSFVYRFVVIVLRGISRCFVCVIALGDFLAFVRLSAVSLPKCEIRLVGVQVEL